MSAPFKLALFAKWTCPRCRVVLTAEYAEGVEPEQAESLLWAKINSHLKRCLDSTTPFQGEF